MIRITLIVLVFAFFAGGISSAFSQVRTSADEIFLARVSAKVLFAECLPETCDDQIFVTVHRSYPRMGVSEEFPQIIGELPTPLSSAVAMSIYAGVGVCDTKALSIALLDARQQSMTISQGILAVSFLDELQSCFNGSAGREAALRRVLLFWKAGAVHAYVQCLSGVCGFQYMPPALDVSNVNFSVGVNATGFGAEHLEEVLSAPNQFLERLTDLMRSEQQPLSLVLQLERVVATNAEVAKFLEFSMADPN